MTNNGHAASQVDKVEASIDWLTITYRDTTARREAYALICDYMRQAESDGWQRKDWSSYGFDGMSYGGYSWGTRDDCDMIRISGGAAHEAWKAFYDLGGNVTRLDAAITVSLREPARQWASGEYGRIALQMDADTRWRKYSIVQGSDGGETLYVGSRSSRWFGRLYDKGIEEGTDGAGYRWRYEVEAKEEAASALASNIRRSKLPARELSAFVHGWFSERRVRPLWDAAQCEASIAILKKETTVEQKLRWLTEQVAPSVAFLRQRGELVRVLDALGLDGAILERYNRHINGHRER